MLDGLLAMYLLGLGEFDLGDDNDTFSSADGVNRGLAWAAFCLATFIIAIVFMNMLIAIMGDTFGKVQERGEENKLKEQVGLMADFVWLLDLAEVFDRKKYVIRCFVESVSEAGDADVASLLQDVQNAVLRRGDSLHGQVMNRIESMEKNTRLLVKAQAQKVNRI